jgi:hypothetical protein
VSTPWLAYSAAESINSGPHFGSDGRQRGTKGVAAAGHGGSETTLQIEFESSGVDRTWLWATNAVGGGSGVCGGAGGGHGDDAHAAMTIVVTTANGTSGWFFATGSRWYRVGRGVVR